MSYAIIGLGKIGTAIAQAFARQGIEVAVAGRRPVDALAAQIGPSLIPQRVEDAVKADVVVLAMPFAAHREIARAAEKDRHRRNQYVHPPRGVGRTALNRRHCKGAAGREGGKGLQPSASRRPGPRTDDPSGGRRVVFLSSDDDAASASVAALVDRLGFAPIELGKLDEGGLLIQARGNTWGRLIFQDLAKFD